MIPIFIDVNNKVIINNNQIVSSILVKIKEARHRTIIRYLLSIYKTESSLGVKVEF